VPVDIDIILSKSDFDHCKNYRVISKNKVASYTWIGEHGSWGDAHGKESTITPNHSAYGHLIKMNGFLIEYWLFWAIAWYSGLSSSKVTKLCKFLLGKMEQQQCFSSTGEPSRQLLEVYKNKFVCARDHKEEFICIHRLHRHSKTTLPYSGWCLLSLAIWNTTIIILHDLSASMAFQCR